MRFEQASYSFIVPASIAAGVRNRGVFSSAPLISVKITLEFRKEKTIRTDSTGIEDVAELQDLNDLINQHVISSVGDAIREHTSALISNTALARIETTAIIEDGGTAAITSAPTQATNIDFTIFTKDPCPVGDCWIRDYAKGICVPKANCALVQCDHDTMFISFKSDLFGMDDGNQPNLRPNGELSPSALPAWNSETERWDIRCVLGTCGMDISAQNE